MRAYRIAVEGDNEALHEEWLREIVELIEGKPHGSVYRAWIENPELTSTGQDLKRLQSERVVR